MGACAGSDSRGASYRQQFLLPKVELQGKEWIQDELGGICGESVDLILEQKMKDVPHRHIGVVLAVHPCGVFQLGTGILLSSNLVLTCAHVIHCKAYQNNQFPRICFYPAQYGKLSFYIDVEKSETPEQYCSDQKWLFRKAYDYSLLKLKENVKETDFLSISGDLPQLDQKTTLTINGYPQSKYDKINKKPIAVKQYGLTRTGYILDVYSEASYLVHRISAQSGQSGAPVIKIQPDGNMTIIGLHIGTPEQDNDKYTKLYPDLKKANLTKLINRPMVERLKKFAIKLEGEIFGVVSKESAVIKKLEDEKTQLQKTITSLMNSIPLTGSKTREGQNRRSSSKRTQRQQSPGAKEPGYSAHFKKDSIKTKNQFIQEGNKLQKATRYKQALECYQRVLDIYPDEVIVNCMIAGILSKLDRNEEAVVSYRKVLEKQPRDANTHFSLGTVLFNLGRTKEAIERYQEGLKIDPEQATILCNLGFALHKLEKKEEAKENYIKAMKINPQKPEPYLMLGVISNEQGQQKEALDFLNQAVKLDPKLLNAWENKASIQYGLQMYEEAVKSYKEILKTQANNIVILNNIIIALFNLNRYDEVVDNTIKLIRLDHQKDSIYEIIRILLLNKRITRPKMTELLKLLENVLAKNQNNQQVKSIVDVLKTQLKPIGSIYFHN